MSSQPNLFTPPLPAEERTNELIANTNANTDSISRQEVTPQEPTLPQSTEISPIEVKWNIPAWMMRHPGPRIEVEDDDLEEAR